MSLKLPKSGSPIPEPRMTLLQKMAVSTQRTEEIRQRKRQTAGGCGACDPAVLLSLWQQAVRRTFGAETPVESRKVDALILHAERKRQLSQGKAEQFIALMEWSIENWRPIMDQHFSGMTNKCPYPVIRFLVRCLGTFQLAYSEKGRLEKRMNMTTRELMVDTLVRKGRSQEAAEREVDERLGLLELRDAIAAERKKLQQLQNRQQETKQLEERIAMMDRTISRKQTRAVAGVGGTYEQWT